MKPGLSLDVQQSLKLSPQLQQAIHLLQLTCTELRQEILAECEKNPLLELEEGSAEEVSFEDSAPSPQTGSSSGLSATEWETPVETSLRDHLLWQMQLTPFSSEDEHIATIIIDSVQDDGYLPCPLEGLIPDGLDIDEARAVQHRIQQFDPLGVACHRLDECLQVQAKHFFEEDPLYPSIEKAITQHLSLIASKGATGLAKKLQLSPDHALDIITAIQGLNPKPGTAFGASHSEYVIPDAFIRKAEDHWQVRLNISYLPKVSLQKEYMALMQSKTKTPDAAYLKGHMQQAKWFLKCLENRNLTLTRVLTAIVAHQKAYFEHGNAHMRPLVLQTIADELSLHPSTVSRVTLGKYIHTPHGTIPIKHIFSSKILTEQGEARSQVAIKALLGQVIQDEDKMKPQSDEKISQMMKTRGIHIARRTVAKYRESLGIGSARERRSK